MYLFLYVWLTNLVTVRILHLIPTREGGGNPIQIPIFRAVDHQIRSSPNEDDDCEKEYNNDDFHDDGLDIVNKEVRIAKFQALK